MNSLSVTVNPNGGRRDPIVSSHDVPVTREALFPQICVRDPYFAWEDIYSRSDATLHGRVRRQLALGPEAGSISAAEAGRHLAILGSCAAARLSPRPGRHFYLARKAELRRGFAQAAPGLDDALVGEARAAFTGRRGATAWTQLLTPRGTPIFDLKVEYDVLPEAVFHRFFNFAKQDLRAASNRGRSEARHSEVSFRELRTNPYREPLSLTGTEIVGPAIRAWLDAVDPRICKGHFPMYPVLPVASVMGGLAQVSYSLLRHMLGDVGAQFIVLRGDIEAANLAVAGERVKFEATHVSQQGGQHTLQCRAVVEPEKPIGEMTLVVQRV